MNWVDIVILVLVLGTGFMGWRNGVIRLAFTLVGGVAGLILAGQLFDDVAPAVPVGDNEGVQQLIAFVVVLGVVLIISWILARIVKTILTILLLGWVDGVAGAVLGLLIGALMATAFVSAAGIVPSDTVKEAVTESSLAEPLSDNLDFVRALLPDQFDSVKDLLDQGTSLFQTGSDLLTGGSDFLARSQEIRDLLEQGGSLLEQSDRLQELIDQGEGLIGSGAGFVLDWRGLDDFAGSRIFVVFEPESADAIKLGPLQATVGTDGTASRTVVDGFDGNSAYDIYWVVDGNGNGTCDEANADVKGHENASADESPFEIVVAGLSDEGVCDHLS